MSILAASVAGLYATKASVLEMVLCMAATKDVLAVSKTEVDLSNIAEGRVQVVKWQGKPVFIYHRCALLI